MREKHYWILYAIGLFFTTSAATFVTHSFMVKALQVGLSSIKNDSIKLVVEPLLTSGVRSWPKFLIGVFGFFIDLSYIGDFTIIGSVGFNLHISFAIALFTLTGASFKTSFGIVVLDIFLLIIALVITYIFRTIVYTNSILYNLFFFIPCVLYFGFLAFLPIIRKRFIKSKSFEEYDMDDTEGGKANGSSSFTFIEIPKRYARCLNITYLIFCAISGLQEFLDFNPLSIGFSSLHP